MMSGGEVVRWRGGQVVRWSAGQVDRWSGGQVVRWSGGQVVRWSGGQVGRWSGGQVVRWSGGQVVRWTDRWSYLRVRYSLDSDEASQVLLLVPNHHAVGDKVGELGLDPVLDGVGRDILAPAGDDHVLDPAPDGDEAVVDGGHVAGEQPEAAVKGFPGLARLAQVTHEHVPAGCGHLADPVRRVLQVEPGLAAGGRPPHRALLDPVAVSLSGIKVVCIVVWIFGHPVYLPDDKADAAHEGHGVVGEGRGPAVQAVGAPVEPELGMDLAQEQLLSQAHLEPTRWTPRQNTIIVSSSDPPGPVHEPALGPGGLAQLRLQLAVHLLEDPRHRHKPRRPHLSEGFEEGALESVLVSEVDGAANNWHHPDV